MPSPAKKFSIVTKTKIGDPNILDRVIPKNPKYTTVKHVIDTGSSMSAYLERLTAKAKCILPLGHDIVCTGKIPYVAMVCVVYKYKPNELFKRIKPQTFARLLHETSISVDLNAVELQHLIALTTASSSPNNGFVNKNASVPKTSRQEAASFKNQFCKSSVLPSVESEKAREQADQLAVQQRPLTQSIDVPFLLLDVRSAAEFAKEHILTATSYNPTRLQSAHQFTSEMLKFKNAADRLIIVYDVDETVASKVAQDFAERGIENVWMLSGGVQALKENFKCLLVSHLQEAHESSSFVDFFQLQEILFNSEPEPTLSMYSVRSSNSRTSSVSRKSLSPAKTASASNRFVPRSRGAGGLSF